MIIGLVGFIGAGKNTVASHLIKKHHFTQDSFAHTLKDACSVIFNWPRHLMEGDTDESRVWRERVDPWWSEKLGIEDFTPRYAMQHLGTNTIRKHFHKDIWTLSLEHRIQYNDKTVISDVRFPNEIDLVRKNGGFIVLVDNGVRPEWYEVAKRAYKGDITAIKTMETTYSTVHESEWAWVGTQLDATIFNVGTLCELKSNTESVLSQLYNFDQK
jgi:hypothetical protein